MRNFLNSSLSEMVGFALICLAIGGCIQLSKDPVPPCHCIEKKEAR